VARVRAEIEAGERVRYLHASSRALIAAGERVDRISGGSLLPFDRLEALFAHFDIAEPIRELGPSRHRLWAPDLVRPSKHSFIAPSVMADDPCLNDTRIPTATVYILRTERDLSSEDIVALYPEVDVEAVEDAHGLEPPAPGSPSQRRIGSGSSSTRDSPSRRDSGSRRSTDRSRSSTSATPTVTKRTESVEETATATPTSGSGRGRRGGGGSHHRDPLREDVIP
jgi:uncharacterized protein (DUF433 family)